MAEKKFVLMSLNEKNTKKLASLLNSDTARKILDYLSGVEYASETKISKETGIALSTVHYNIKLLRENKLINEEEFHYSEKGKEIIHYKAANKYIIIAPEGEDESILDKLKNILPGFVGLIIGSIALFSYSLFGRSTNLDSAIPGTLMAKSAQEAIVTQTASSVAAGAAADVATGTVNEAVAESTIQVANYVASDAVVTETSKAAVEPLAKAATEPLTRTAPDIINHTTQYATNMPTVVDPWLWFLYGGLFVLIVIILYILIKNKLEKKTKNKIKPL